MTKGGKDDAAACSAEECRRRAEELRVKAGKARTPEVRQELLLMADDWDGFARRREQSEERS